MLDARRKTSRRRRTLASTSHRRRECGAGTRRARARRSRTSRLPKWLDDGAAVWYDAVVESSEPRGDGLALSVRYVDGGEVDDIDWPSEDAAVAPPGNRKAKRKAGALPESGAKRQA